MITAATSKYVSASSSRRRARRRTRPRRRACRSRSACPSSRRGGARSGARRGGSRSRPRATTGVASARRATPSPRTGAAGPSRAPQRRRQRGGDDEPQAKPRASAVLRRAGLGRRASRRSRRPRPRRRARRPRRAGVVADGGLLGRVVDGGLDAVELVELPLDTGRARGARHALEGELDAVSVSSVSRWQSSRRLVVRLLDRRAQRSVVELAAVHRRRASFEVDVDLVDALDLGELFRIQPLGSARSGSREPCT